MINIKKKLSHRHHCIPQFYLNKFGIRQKNNTYKIHVYNKNINKKFPNAVSNISIEKNYNTTNINDIEDDIYERYHNDIYEQRIHKIYYAIISKIENHFKSIECINCLSETGFINICYKDYITEEEKLFLARVLAYFIIRNKKIRYICEELCEKMKLIYEDIYKTKNLDISKLHDNIYSQMGNKITRKNDYIRLPFDIELNNKLAKIIFNHIWTIGYNKTNKLIYINDNAHALDCMDLSSISRCLGFNTYGNVIYFPLTPRICILMYDYQFLKNNSKTIIDRKYSYLDEELINVINCQIVYYGIDEVYSQNGDWNDLDLMIKNNEISLGHKPYVVS